MAVFKPYGSKGRKEGELCYCSSGYEACVAGKEVGPSYPDFYIIHFIKGGKGRYLYKGTEYSLSPGKAFIMFPGEVVSYIPDEKDPWEYYWLGIHGTKAEALIESIKGVRDVPVIEYDSGIIPLIKQTKVIMSEHSPEEIKDLALLSLIYQILYIMGKETDVTYVSSAEHSSYLKRATYYMENSYHRSISIQEIADAVHIDRTYLFLLFKKELGMSPKEYLVQFRIRKACLIIEGDVHNSSLKRVGQIVGYKDYSLFSKMFKKQTGLSPKAYKEKYKVNKEALHE